MICNKCGTEFDDSFRFCPKCGNPVKSMESHEEIHLVASEEGTNAEESFQSLSDTTKTLLSNKKIVIIVSIIIIFFLVLLFFLATRPKLQFIATIQYNGSTDKGTVINSDSDITVLGFYSDNKKRALHGWSIDETVLSPGWNSINISYDDFLKETSIYSPLMGNGVFYATCEEIKDTFNVVCDSNEEANEWKTTGKTDDEDETGYSLGDGDMDANLTFKKDEDNNSVDSLEDVPDTMKIYGSLLVDSFSEYFDEITILCAIGVATLDNRMSYSEAKTFAEDTIQSLRNSEVHSIGNSKLSINLVSYDTSFNTGYLRTTIMNMGNNVDYIFIFYGTRPEPIEFSD